MNRLMKCMGCRDEMALAYANRELSSLRILLFCPTCAKTFWQNSNWKRHVAGVAIKPIVCLGCDRQSYHAHVNHALQNVIAFCYRCADKLMLESKWEECRRGENQHGEYDDYAPDIIVQGHSQRGGH